MRKRALISFQILFIFLILSVMVPGPSFCTQSISDIHVMTENYPPYNFMEDGKLQGICVEVLLEIFKRTGARQTVNDIELLPWARGYRNLQHQKNSCLFGMARTPKRENLFKWAGPITDGRAVLIALNSSDLSIKTFDDVNKYRVGVVKDDMGEQCLIKAGIKKANLDYSYGENAAKEIIVKLNSKIVDMWLFDEISARWMLKKYGFDSKLYKTVYVVSKVQVYYAFHKDVSDKLINRFQAVLDDLIKEGVYQKIVSRYLSEGLD